MATYNDYPQSATNNAKKVLEWKKKYGKEVKGMTPVGWARARQLASKSKLSYETIARMAAFNRHRKNAEIDPKYKIRLGRTEAMLLGLGGEELQALIGRLEKLNQSEKEQLRLVLTSLTSRMAIEKSKLKNRRRKRITLLKEKMVALRNLPKHLRVILLKRILKVLEKVESYLQRLLSL